MAEGPRRRLRLVAVVLVGLVVVLVAQLVQVQVLDHAFYAAWAAEQNERQIAMSEAPRGSIRDRNGHVLAGNVVMYSIEANTATVMDAQRAAAALEPLVHMSPAQVEELLSREDPWVRITAPVSKEVGEEVAALQIRGITARPVWARGYPEGELAAHVLGFCNSEGRGFYGVEGFYDDVLQAEQLAWTGQVDLSSDQVPWDVAPVLVPQPGMDLELTLDRTVQLVVEEELARSVREYQAEGGTIIVLDAGTFEILAMASVPAYSPGGYLDWVDGNAGVFVDPAISEQYEPGSVFKVLTVAAALDAGVVTPETTYNDEGWMEVGGLVVANAFRQARGEQTVSDVLIHSLNVGAARLSVQMGAETFYRYVQAFGIGRRTGVDLAGEVAGQLWLPEDYERWHESSLGTNAFGQGLAVTPLQMAVAVATVANDGARLRPHVVRRRVAASGLVSTHQPVADAHPISVETARTVTEMMVRTVEEGVTQARVEGYRVAGKTGTAQIPVPGGYDRDGTIASFVGFGPVPDPRLVILVKLDRPKTSPWGAETAARSFQRLATQLFLVLGIPPEGRQAAEAVR
jgi:cell division protein FtsI/penicillin-binding protein 2